PSSMNAVGVAHGIKSATLDQRFEHPSIQLLAIDTRRKVEEISKGPATGPHLKDALQRGSPHSANGSQTKTNARTIGVFEFAALLQWSVALRVLVVHSEVGVARVDVRWQDGGPPSTRLGDRPHHLFNLLFVRRERCRKKLCRIMGLEVGGLIGNQGISRR